LEREAALYRDRRRSSRDVKRLALCHAQDLERKIEELTAIRNTVLRPLASIIERTKEKRPV
jgi:hypothetical protein